MAKKSVSTRLAHAAFGVALFTFLGPGFHYSSNPGVKTAGLALEAAWVGVAIGVVALALGLSARKRLLADEDRTGLGYANAAVAIAGVGLVVWLVALVLSIVR